MKRRKFLGLLGAVPVIATLPDEAVSKTELSFSIDELNDKYIQPAVEKLASTILPLDIILREFMRLVVEPQRINFVRSRATVDNKIGDSVRLLNGSGSTVVLDRLSGMDIEVPVLDVTLGLDEFSDRHIVPAATKMVDEFAGQSIVCGGLPVVEGLQYCKASGLMSARITRQFDIRADLIIYRFDMLYGSPKLSRMDEITREALKIAGDKLLNV